MKKPGFFRLVWSDYRAHFAYGSESTLRAVLTMLPRYVFNPSLQFAWLVRIAQRGPALIHHPVRWLQVVFFSSECYWFRGGDESIEIGPGINFPHPIGIIIGPGTRIGSNVTIYNNVNIGTDRSGDPTRVWSTAVVIEDGVFIFGFASVMGPFKVGRRAVLGKWAILDEDVPAGALKSVKGLRLEGEWDRSRIWPQEAKKPDGKVPA